MRAPDVDQAVEERAPVVPVVLQADQHIGRILGVIEERAANALLQHRVLVHRSVEGVGGPRGVDGPDP